MKNCFRLFLIFLILISCKRETPATTINPLTHIPKNSSVIVKINNFQELKSSLKNNSFIQELTKTNSYKILNKKITALSYFSTQAKGALCFLEEGNNNYEILFINTSDSTLLNIDSSKVSTETYSFENKQVIKHTLNSESFYMTNLNNVNIVSSSKLQIENAIRVNGKNEPNQTLKKLYESSNTNKSATIFINNNKSSVFLKTLLSNNEVSVDKFSDWLALDINASQNALHLNGVAITHQNSPKTATIYSNTHPLENNTISITPITANGFTSVSFDDFKTIQNNQISYYKNNTPFNGIENDSVFNDITEIGTIKLANGKAIAVYTEFPETLNTYLSDIETETTEFTQTTLHKINNPKLLTSFLSPLATNIEANYYCIIENFFVFAASQQILQSIITNYNNNTLFSSLPNYKNTISQLADESSKITVLNNDGIKQFIKDNAPVEFVNSLKDVPFSRYTFASQLVADANFHHINILLEKGKTTSTSGTVAQLFSSQLDAVIVTEPQFVTNHRTKKKEIVVQDQENNLYLISTDGKVLWKKQLDSQIQGKIHQVDIYRNGRLQLAFNTQHQFYIVDRNGVTVAPFHKKFNGLLLPLAVFDYEKNKDYRFVITEGKKIHMYNRNFTIVNGFNFTKTQSTIIKTPQHFRIENKDYITVAEENGTLNILNRRGHHRIKIKDKINFSENNLYLYLNKFTFTDSKGFLIQYDSKGKKSSQNINLQAEHYIDATSKTLTTLTDNILTIKDKKVALDFGFYTAPKIFYIYDKIYVSVTDTQNQKVYLFDSNAQPIKNFPVYGTAAIDLQDIDGDQKLELVTKGLDNTVLLYNLN